MREIDVVGSDRKGKTVKSGMIIYGETVRIGYFKQHDVEMDGEMRVIDYIKESGEVESSFYLTAICNMQRSADCPAVSADVFIC